METMMTKQEFLEKFSYNVLQLSSAIDEDATLKGMNEWDSLAQISAIGFFDKEFGVKVTFQEIENVQNIKELVQRMPS